MRIRLAGCLVALLGFVAAASADLTLVENGTPKAVIVVPAAALVEPPAPDPKAKPKPAPFVKPQARRAAEEIQHYIEKMSGAKLPIVTEGAAIEGEPIVIAVGRTAAADKLGVKIPSGYDRSVRADAFDEEGYVLRTAGKQLIVAGNEDGPYLGTRYAAAALLERLGVRWYFPGEWGEVVPRRKTVAVPDLDVTSKPDFTVRSVNLSGWVPTSREEREQYEAWAVRVGMNLSQMYPVPGDGFLAYLIEPNEYFESHPDYFAMNRQGQREVGRQANGKPYARTTMLCLSNPDVFSESVKNLRAAFAGEKKLVNVTDTGVGISPPDGAPYCFCPECLKQSQNFQYPQYVHQTAQSEEVFAFASRLAKEFPDKFVATMAYALREFPPQGVELPDNVMVKYAPIANDVMHPHDSKLWRHVEFLSMLRQFRRQTPHITLYDYNPGFLAGSFVPERDAENMAVNAPIYQSVGLKGFTREGRKAFMQTWISYYLGAKLMWDAEADVDAIKDDFYSTFFGEEAGEHVRAWWDGCAQRLVESPLQAHEDWVINHLYDLAFVRGLQKHVDAARAAVASGDDQQKQRVEAFALIADHLLAYAEVSEAEKKLDYAAASAAAQRMTDDKIKLHAMYSFFIEVPKVVPPRKPRTFFSEGRKLKFDELHAKTNGERGTLISPLPPEMKFKRDPFNTGIPMEWYATNHDDKAWATMDTFYLWDQQEEFEDEAGHDYDGYGWYRGTFGVDRSFAGKPVKFFSGGASNEAWVWINGRYAGKSVHRLWWSHPHDFELDVTGLVKAGEENTIAIRVLSDSEIGGLFRRGFFYSPKE